MKKNKNSDLNPYKSALVNILYHTGFNNYAIKKIAGIPLSQISKNVVK